MNDQITIRGARLHNLKNLSLTIPKNRLVVFTGLSGSGKSTLGLDILYKEGVRQFLEALGFVAYGMARPPLDSLSGLTPAISIDQYLTNRSPRSTVGTATEVYTYLRALFARLGARACPNCGRPAPPTYNQAEEWDPESSSAGGPAQPEAAFPCPQCGAPLIELSMAHFSFNKPEGACPACTGLGFVQQANLARLVDEEKSIAGGAVLEWNAPLTSYHATILQAAAAHYGFALDLAQPLKTFNQAQRDLLFYGVESEQFRRHFPGRPLPPTVRQGRFEGVATALLRRYAEHIQDAEYSEKMQDLLTVSLCPACGGERLRPESRAVTLAGQTIPALARLALSELGGWLAQLPAALDAPGQTIAAPALAELAERIRRLVEVGAGYLTMERAAPSLSAGEAQRLRLASLLGSELSGVLYIFDEPTVGLHPRDTQRLVGVLQRLRDLGNSVLVIEHDLEIIAAADHVVDFGPGAGKHGGKVVAQGAPAEVAANPASLTGAYLCGRAAIPVPRQRRPASGAALTIRGARCHNLKNLEVRLPLGVLLAVTGVSGSGKSTLIFDILDRALRQRLYQAGPDSAPGEHDTIDGLEQIDKIITIDQEHIGRMARSNAATYSDAFTPIRAAFAASPDAQRLGLTARDFSFNLPGGRCERCQGAGVLSVNMQLLPAVEVRCPVCQGRRFTRRVLQAHYRGADIAQVLDMTIEEALELFQEAPAVRGRLQVLSDVGLGYLQLGQPADTLSGGEAQRVKLAKELGRRASRRTLYLLDEPTTGLHLADVQRLLSVLQRLVAAGSSVIVVEHNMELVKTADWVIDLGPEGGAAGGQVVAVGTPEQIAAAPGSYTGAALSKIL